MLSAKLIDHVASGASSSLDPVGNDDVQQRIPESGDIVGSPGNLRRSGRAMECMDSR